MKRIYWGNLELTNMPRWKGFLQPSSSAKKEYSKRFKKADTKADKILDGEEAKQFFDDSGVERKILAAIW